jgi:hypothetical protein
LLLPPPGVDGKLALLSVENDALGVIGAQGSAPTQLLVCFLSFRL